MKRGSGAAAAEHATSRRQQIVKTTLAENERPTGQPFGSVLQGRFFRPEETSLYKHVAGMLADDPRWPAVHGMLLSRRQLVEIVGNIAAHLPPSEAHSLTTEGTELIERGLGMAIADFLSEAVQ